MLFSALTFRVLSKTLIHIYIYIYILYIYILYIYILFLLFCFVFALLHRFCMFDKAKFYTTTKVKKEWQHKYALQFSKSDFSYCFSLGKLTHHKTVKSAVKLRSTCFINLDIYVYLYGRWQQMVIARKHWSQFGLWVRRQVEWSQV